MLPGFILTDLEKAAQMTQAQLLERAINLLKENEPENGYQLAFSGGKDSCAINQIAKLAGVKFSPFYAQTTIDPPELVRFIKENHPEVKWITPKNGNMMRRIVDKPAAPPTRMVRWCCDEYKENCEKGTVKIMGVRAMESKARETRWKEKTKDRHGDLIICPIVFWSDEQLWQFIKSEKIKYCTLYDEGFNRLGCVGCPLNNEARDREFLRWPKFKENWKKAVIGNWEKWRNIPKRNGEKRFQSNFKTGEEMFSWWMQQKTANVFNVDCQTLNLWEVEPSFESEVVSPSLSMSHNSAALG